MLPTWRHSRGGEACSLVARGSRWCWSALELLACAVTAVLVLDATVTPAFNRPEASLADVTFFLTVTEGDVQNIYSRVPFLDLSLQGLRGRRIFVVDAHRKNGTVSADLSRAMQTMVQLGHMDDVMVFRPSWNESSARNLHFAGGAAMKEFPRIGNEVYYWMPEVCPTRFLLHYDMDILLWTRPGRSWVSDARKLVLSAKPDQKIWYVLAPQPIYFLFVRQYDWNFMLYRLLRVALNFDVVRWMFEMELLDYGEPSSQSYFLDTWAYRDLTADPGRFPEMVHKYKTDHWERAMYVPHRLGKYRAIVLSDFTAYWVAHCPRVPALRAGSGTATERLVRQGFAVPENFGERLISFANEESFQEASETLPGPPTRFDMLLVLAALAISTGLPRWLWMLLQQDGRHAGYDHRHKVL